MEYTVRAIGDLMKGNASMYTHNTKQRTHKIITYLHMLSSVVQWSSYSVCGGGRGVGERERERESNRERRKDQDRVCVCTRTCIVYVNAHVSWMGHDRMYYIP